MSEDAAKKELAALDPRPDGGPKPQTPAGCCLLCSTKDSLILLGSRQREALRLDLYRCVECEGLTALDSDEGDPPEQYEALLEELRAEIVAALYRA
jgi:hypothetical protein